MKTIKELFDYRNMIFMLVKRDLRGRYRGSVLGFAWTFINPILQLLVYTVVFSFVMRANIEKYYLFVFVALIPWLAMSGSVTGGSSCILTNNTMVTKIYFPRQVLPIATVTAAFINMLLSMVIVLVVCVITNGLNILVLWYLIPTILIEYILALGIAFIVSAVTVYFRDLEHILQIFVMAWQFLSPIVYSIDMVPESARKVFMLNPMASIIISYRDILYYKQAPHFSTMLLALGMGIGFLIAGWFIFKKLNRRFAEVL